jgi:hypothetical protein
VLQLGDLLLHTLLDDGFFFALILKEFLQNIEDSEFIELNALA